jgi:hypothetical protein
LPVLGVQFLQRIGTSYNLSSEIVAQTFHDQKPGKTNISFSPGGCKREPFFCNRDDSVMHRFNATKDKRYIWSKMENMDTKIRPPLTEKVLVSTDTKQALMFIKEPGERYGDVIARVLLDRKREDFIAHLDRIARKGDFIPLDNDPEYQALKEEMHRASGHRKTGAAVH